MSITMSTERLIYGAQNSTEILIDQNGIHILDESLKVLHEKENTGIFSACFSGEVEATNIITYNNIIWCEKMNSDEHEDLYRISFMYASSKSMIVHQMQAQVSNFDGKLLNISPEERNNVDLSSFILSKAYPHNRISPSILVLINPFGGQGKAVQIYKTKILPILEAANVKITYQETKYHGHAADIAKELDPNKYGIIACCSGDGIPHQVINGFYQRSDKGVEAFNKIAVTQLPCGSGNALSLSTYGSNDASVATLAMLKSQKTKLDLMAVSQGTGSEESTKLSFLTQCYGVIADSDIGTEHLRWMGPVRFELGILHKLVKGATYPCEIYVDYLAQSKQDILEHYDKYSKSDDQLNKVLKSEDFELKYPKLNQPPPDNWLKVPDHISSKLNLLYVGKMPYITNDAQFFPATLPNDGAMDMILTDTNASIIESMSLLLSVEKGKHIDHDMINYSKILGYRLVPKLANNSDHYLSVDGEEFPFEPLQVEILPGILTGLLHNGSFIDTSFTN